MRKKFDSLREASAKQTPNDEHENFVTANMEPNPNPVFDESLAVRKNWDNVKNASLCDKRNPANANVLKLKKDQCELIHNRNGNYNTFMAKSIKSEIQEKLDNNH